jgi:hypothetical protein
LNAADFHSFDGFVLLICLPKEESILLSDKCLVIEKGAVYKIKGTPYFLKG